MKNLFLILAVLFCTSRSHATGVSDCLKGSVEDQLSCVEVSFRESERDLNTTYKRVVEALEKSQKFGNDKNFEFENIISRLKIAQRSWLYFRAGQCELESFIRINEVHLLSAQIACNARLNQERTAWLKKFFGDQLKIVF
jgi:uncharacterized protein YecT (DUF1311 family)